MCLESSGQPGRLPTDHCEHGISHDDLDSVLEQDRTFWACQRVVVVLHDAARCAAVVLVLLGFRAHFFEHETSDSTEVRGTVSTFE